MAVCWTLLPAVPVALARGPGESFACPRCTDPRVSWVVAAGRRPGVDARPAGGRGQCQKLDWHEL